MKTRVLVLAFLCQVMVLPGQTSTNTQGEQLSSFKLLFTDEEDVTDVWGKLRFEATPLRSLGECDDPGFEIKCCVPRGDGAWDVYGYSGGHDIYGEQADPTRSRSTWKIHHAVTRDAVHYEKGEVVFTSDSGA